MALLKGFPPSNLISPSVRISEVDLSFIPVAANGHNAGLVGFASKGPINVPTLINSILELHTTFGYPHPDVGDPYLLYAGEQYLNFGSQLFVVRCGTSDNVNDEGALTASVDIPSTGGPVQIESNTAGSYVFPNDLFFMWRLNGILAAKTLVVLAGTYTVTSLVNALNSQLVPSIDGIEFYWNNPAAVTGLATLSSKISVQSVFSYGTLATIEFVSVQDSLYGPTWDNVGLAFVPPISGLGSGMLPAALTGTQDRYPNNSSQTAGHYDFSAISGLNLQIVVDGSNNILIDNLVQVVTLTATAGTTQDIVDEINAKITSGAIPGGFVAIKSGNFVKLQTLHTGADARILVKSASTAAALLGLNNQTQSGVSPTATSGVSNFNAAIVTGNANSTGTVCFTVTADSPGIDGNQTQIQITNNIVEGTFTLEVFSYGNQVESWGRLSKDEANSFFVESYLSLVSSYIRVINNDATLALPANGLYILSGGTDGIPSDPDQQDLLLVGSDIAMTGLQALSDPEQIDIDLVAVPGHPSTGNIASVLDFCQNIRGDCFAIIEPPFGLGVTEIIQWQNGVHPLNDVQFNSNFGSLYWPWVKLQDNFNKVQVWVPPAGVVLGAIARSDGITAPWIAPAGTTRGQCLTVLDVFSRPSLAERDSMYGSTNAVNPIISLPDIGSFVIMGNKTLQRTPTALDRINVRRMLLFVEKEIKLACRSLLFEPNDPVLWGRFIRLATTVLTDVLNGRGILDFQIQCDATTNTPDVVDRNELRAKIGVVPTKAAEFIFIEFDIFNTSALNTATF